MGCFLLLFSACNQKELEVTKQKVTALQNSLDSIKQKDDVVAGNKQMITDFYNLIYNTKNLSVVDKFVSPDLIEHNPQGKNGADELKRFLEFIYTLYPKSLVEIKRVVSDGDLVVVHALKKMIKDDRGAAAIEIFRIENGKIIEHWDVSQSIPSNSSNNNGMF